MSGYRTDIVYNDSENSLYCDEVQIFKKAKKILAKIDYSSSSQFRKNTSSIKLDFEELIDNISTIKEITCEGVSKKVSRYFKTLDKEPKKLRRYCLVVVGEVETEFECKFDLSNEQITITRK